MYSQLKNKQVMHAEREGIPRVFQGDAAVIKTSTIILSVCVATLQPSPKNYMAATVFISRILRKTLRISFEGPNSLWWQFWFFSEKHHKFRSGGWGYDVYKFLGWYDNSKWVSLQCFQVQKTKYIFHSRDRIHCGGHFDLFIF